MAQCFLPSKLLGQPPVATSSHIDTLLHVSEVQIDYPLFYCHTSSTLMRTMFKGGRPVKAEWEICLKWKVMEKQLLDESSVVTRCHPNVIECRFIIPSAENNKFI